MLAEIGADVAYPQAAIRRRIILMRPDLLLERLGVQHIPSQRFAQDRR